MNYKEHKPLNSQSGNILFLILIAIAMFGILTAVISNSTKEHKETLNRQTVDAQISVVLNYVSSLSSALLNLVMAGADQSTIYQNLLTLKPGDDGYEESPHQYKIFHPLGGGIEYLSSSTNTSSSALATNFNINKGSIITGVGKSDALIGDIVFTARITSEDYCQAINKKINGSTSIPEMSDSTFNTLFTSDTEVTVDSSNCPDCVGITRSCISNSSDSEWGFYSVLFPN